LLLVCILLRLAGFKLDVKFQFDINSRGSRTFSNKLRAEPTIESRRTTESWSFHYMDYAFGYPHSYTHNPIAWLVSLAYNRSHWLQRSSDSAVLGSHLRYFRITSALLVSINFIIPALPEIEKPGTRLTAHGVELSWTAPKNSLNETILYNVTCFICSQRICNISCQNETYNPGSNNLRQTRVIVSNLIAGEKYVFIVHVSVKDAVPEGEWSYKTVHVQVISGKELHVLFGNILYSSPFYSTPNLRSISVLILYFRYNYVSN
jgi:hypothetical protein